MISEEVINQMIEHISEGKDGVLIMLDKEAGELRYSWNGEYLEIVGVLERVKQRVLMELETQKEN